MNGTVVDAYLQIFADDMAAARRLVDCVPRMAACHLQQAAEKLVKAFLSQEHINFPAAHNIGQLVGMLPDGHEWKFDLAELDFLSRYATAYRYPAAAGRLLPPPSRGALNHYLSSLDALYDEAKRWFGEQRNTSSPKPP